MNFFPQMYLLHTPEYKTPRNATQYYIVILFKTPRLSLAYTLTHTLTLSPFIPKYLSVLRASKLEYKYGDITGIAITITIILFTLHWEE